ncbi:MULTISPECIES: type IV secretion system DNA-binding domain-containing protein [unclassified Burkholderia]|uniref:type IV secretion system DNA-binding domain-containing protein n=1 Tax=unclassified Burkholderia TaxID=2613784 RepID=UPI0009E8A0C6|nr:MULTISPECIES: type IV secretion system DNA-binding domain-containing protein [unclassified Burkholderia]
MAINKRSRLDDFTRGSDALWHSIHMATAGIQRLAIVAGAVALAIFSSALLLVTNAVEREVIFKHYLAELLVAFGVNIAVRLPIGGGVELSASQAADVTGQVIGRRGFVVFVIGAVSIAVGVFVAKRVAAHKMKLGADEATDKFLRGQKIVSADELSGMTNLEARAGYKIGGVGIPDALMTRNAAFMGGMGAGKTQGICHLIDASRPRMKAVVYDTKGDYIQKYYDPARGDIILNPMDLRCAEWSIFDDMQDDIDYRTVARFFIPDAEGGNGQNQIFVNGGRKVLEDVMKLVKMGPDFEKSMSEVARVAMRMPLAELHKYLVRYELDSAQLMTPDNQKAASSFRMEIVTAPALSFFKLFSSSGFSIRKFIESDSAGWLFLASNPKQHEAIAPFVAVWLELAVLAALSGPLIDHMRVQFVLDELATLPRLNALPRSMTLGREYGISTLIGMQNEAQGRHIYGDLLFRTMLANAQTKAIFRTEETESAKALAAFLGSQEVDEATAGNTHGADTARDSSQIGRKRAETALVMASQVQTLPDLTAYLKVAGGYPVAEVTIPYVKRPIIAPAFEPRPLPVIEQREPIAPAYEAESPPELADYEWPTELPPALLDDDRGLF